MGSKARKGIVGKVNWKLSVLIFFFLSLVFATPLCCALFPQKRYVFLFWGTVPSVNPKNQSRTRGLSVPLTGSRAGVQADEGSRGLSAGAAGGRNQRHPCSIPELSSPSPACQLLLRLKVLPLLSDSG